MMRMMIIAGLIIAALLFASPGKAQECFSIGDQIGIIDKGIKEKALKQAIVFLWTAQTDSSIQATIVITDTSGVGMMIQFKDDCAVKNSKEEIMVVAVPLADEFIAKMLSEAEAIYEGGEGRNFLKIPGAKGA